MPDAKFVGGQGNFPLSFYVQGKDEYIAPTGINNINTIAANTSLYPNPADQEINIRTEQKIEKVMMYNMVGQKVWEGNSKKIDITSLQYGVYYVKIRFEGNIVITKSFVKN